MSHSTNDDVTALRTGALVWRLSDVTVFNLRGDDRTSWLNGQITNDTKGLDDGAVFALVVQPKGKILAELACHKEDTRIRVLVASSVAETLEARFDKHIIMEDVIVERSTDVVFTFQGPSAHAVASAFSSQLKQTHGDGVALHPCRRFDVDGYDVIAPMAAIHQEQALRALVSAHPAAAWLERERENDLYVSLGWPRFGVDFGDSHYAQEAGLTKRYVSFSKGCYLGQEVVYMLENRGQVTRRLVVLDAPDAGLRVGDELRTEVDGAIGTVTSVSSTRERALGYVKRKLAEPGAALWTPAGTTATIVDAVSLPL